jgi:hypothetical protein
MHNACGQPSTSQTTQPRSSFFLPQYRSVHPHLPASASSPPLPLSFDETGHGALRIRRPTDYRPVAGGEPCVALDLSVFGIKKNNAPAPTGTTHPPLLNGIRKRIHTTMVENRTFLLPSSRCPSLPPLTCRPPLSCAPLPLSGGRVGPGAGRPVQGVHRGPAVPHE